MQYERLLKWSIWCSGDLSWRETTEHRFTPGRASRIDQKNEFIYVLFCNQCVCWAYLEEPRGRVAYRSMANPQIAAVSLNIAAQHGYVSLTIQSPCFGELLPSHVLV